MKRIAAANASPSASSRLAPPFVATLRRYVLRPPVAQDALELLPGGKVLLRLRRPWRDGTRAICFEPLELLEKLAAMIPKPRVNLLLYHGAFAPHFRDRRGAVRAAQEGARQSSGEQQASCGHAGQVGAAASAAASTDELLGLHGAVMEDSAGPVGTLFHDTYLGIPGLRIAGGTDEILRNIIAERVLGLPPEVRKDKGIPFREIPKGPAS